MIVFKLICGSDGERLPRSGHFLESFDFEADDGIGAATFTQDPARALGFKDFVEAAKFWNTSPVCRPLREDGKPNRPMTSTTWQMMSIESGR